MVEVRANMTYKPNSSLLASARLRFALALSALAAVFLATAFANETPLAQLEKLAREYSITILHDRALFPVHTPYGTITGAVAQRSEAAAYAPILVAEFGLYPTSFVKKTRLRRIVLCRDLRFDRERQEAVPDYVHNTLYLDVTSGEKDLEYRRLIIHREFFHIVDFRDDGWVFSDVRWERINPKAFQYGRQRGFAMKPDPRGSVITDSIPGFLTPRARTGVAQDKAEVFAHLILHPSLVKDRARKDEFVGRKVARMKRLLARFCPDMGASFWTGIQTRESSSEAIGARKHPRLDIPKATWVPLFFETINKRTKAAGLKDLRLVSLTPEVTEVRIWIGFGRRSLRGFVIRRDAEGWQGLYVASIHAPNVTIEPKSGWAKLWKELTDQGLLTLPDSSSLEGRAWVTDGIGYVVEFSSNGTYRTYLYSNPEDQKWPQAKQIIRIIKILSDEFNVKRLF